MAELLIKGERIELPKIGESYIDIRIYETGEIVIDGDQDKTAKAIELPPHGRLIDADELLASDAINWGEEAWNGINHAPVVLEENYE